MRFFQKMIIELYIASSDFFPLIAIFVKKLKKFLKAKFLQ